MPIQFLKGLIAKASGSTIGLDVSAVNAEGVKSTTTGTGYAFRGSASGNTPVAYFEQTNSTSSQPGLSIAVSGFGKGIDSQAQTGAGVQGLSNATSGVVGQANATSGSAMAGVMGTDNNSSSGVADGVLGTTAGSGTALHGKATGTGKALHAEGPATITGAITAQSTLAQTGLITANGGIQLPVGDSPTGTSSGYLQVATSHGLVFNDAGTLRVGRTIEFWNGAFPTVGLYDRQLVYRQDRDILYFRDATNSRWMDVHLQTLALEISGAEPFTTGTTSYHRKSTKRLAKFGGALMEGYDIMIYESAASSVAGYYWQGNVLGSNINIYCANNNNLPHSGGWAGYEGLVVSDSSAPVLITTSDIGIEMRVAPYGSGTFGDYYAFMNAYVRGIG